MTAVLVAMVNLVIGSVGSDSDGGGGSDSDRYDSNVCACVCMRVCMYG